MGREQKKKRWTVQVKATFKSQSKHIKAIHSRVSDVVPHGIDGTEFIALNI